MKSGRGEPENGVAVDPVETDSQTLTYFEVHSPSITGGDFVWGSHYSTMDADRGTQDVGRPLTMRELSQSMLPCVIPWEEACMDSPFPTSKPHYWDCKCEQCAFELEGQFFFCDFYSLWDWEGPSKFHDYLIHCLRGWARIEPEGRGADEPLVYGRVDSTMTCAGSRIYLYRFFVALPCRVKWTRLWEKLFYEADSLLGQGLVQDGRIRECFKIYPLSGMDRSAFVNMYDHCRAAILYDSADKATAEGEFGDETEVISRCCDVDKHLIGRI